MHRNSGTAPISVVIPAFNAGNTLAACVRSILAQSVRPQEIIVVDDGSEDQTATVAQSFGADVRLLRQQNQGSAVARQHGTEEARCEHIAYLDADDWWPEGTIETYAQISTNEDVHFLIADFVRAEPGTSAENHLSRNSSFYPWFLAFASQHGKATTTDRLLQLSADKGLEAMLRGFPYYPSASLARRDSVMAIGGWDRRFRRCQDFDLALRLTRRYPMYYYDAVQAVVGLNEGNRDVTRYVIQQTSGDIRVLHAHHEAAGLESTYRREVEEALSRKYYSLGNTYRHAGDRRSALRAYLRTIRWPSRRAKAAARIMLLPF